MPTCDKIKSKILEEWLELKTKHANLMQIAFLVLSHARICEADSCQTGKSCAKMKSVLSHASKCPKKSDCRTKKFLFSLCQNHNQICLDPSCPVDFCRDKWNRSSNVYSMEKEQTGADRPMVDSINRARFQVGAKTDGDGKFGCRSTVDKQEV